MLTDPRHLALACFLAAHRDDLVMHGGSQRWVFVELDGTLLIIEARAADLETQLLPLLDGLHAVRPATSSADDAVASEAIG